MFARSVAMRLLALLMLLAEWSTASMAQQAPAPRTPEQSLAALIDNGIRERREGKVRASIETLDRALALARANRSLEREIETLAFLALSYRELHELQKVLALRLESLQVVRANPQVFATDFRHEESWQLANLSGTYYLLGDLPNAIRQARAAVDVALPHVSELDTVSIGRHRQQLGVLLFLAGEHAQAERWLRLAYEDFEARVRLMAKVEQVDVPAYAMELGVLRWLQRALAAQGRSDEALEVAERSRARTLATITRRGASGTPPAALTLAQMKTIARRQGTTIVAYTVAYEYDPDLLLEFSDFLDTRAAALLSWVIRPDGRSSFRQIELRGIDKSLADLVADARYSIGARGRGASRGAAPRAVPAQTGTTRYPALQALHRILIEPIQDQLPTEPVKPVVFLPQDVLYDVPFAALQDESGAFLVARHASFVAESVATLARPSSPTKAQGTGVLVVGNPKMPSPPSKDQRPPVALPPLPDAEREARDIAAAFSADALIGAAATKERVLAQMPSARVVHLATHGVLDRAGAEYFNWLALAPAAGDTGFLTVREIDRLNLRADLVVLSACDSTDGKATGDSVLGFSSAFRAAGVPSVVVALWSIPDAPTAQLMRAFYGGLRLGRDEAGALQAAMLQTLKTNPHPSNWAAFELIGNNAALPDFDTIKGNSPASAPDAGAPELLLPPEFSDYQQSPARAGGGPSALFRSTLSMPELLAFYRDAYTKKGLAEDRALTRLEARTANLVMVGPGAQRLVVQLTQWDDPAGGTDTFRFVSVRFEPQHTSAP